MNAQTTAPAPTQSMPKPATQPFPKLPSNYRREDAPAYFPIGVPIQNTREDRNRIALKLPVGTKVEYHQRTMTVQDDNREPLVDEATGLGWACDSSCETVTVLKYPAPALPAIGSSIQGGYMISSRLRILPVGTIVEYDGKLHMIGPSHHSSVVGSDDRLLYEGTRDRAGLHDIPIIIRGYPRDLETPLKVQMWRSIHADEFLITSPNLAFTRLAREDCKETDRNSINFSAFVEIPAGVRFDADIWLWSALWKKIAQRTIQAFIDAEQANKRAEEDRKRQQEAAERAEKERKEREAFDAEAKGGIFVEIGGDVCIIVTAHNTVFPASLSNGNWWSKGAPMSPSPSLRDVIGKHGMSLKPRVLTTREEVARFIARR